MYGSVSLLSSSASEGRDAGEFRKSKSFQGEVISSPDSLLSEKTGAEEGICKSLIGGEHVIDIGFNTNTTSPFEHEVEVPALKIITSNSEQIEFGFNTINTYKTHLENQVVDIDINSDTSPCVFRVPESLTETTPEAYAPQKLGLGPFHHLRPNLYTMQRKKLAAVIKFLNADGTRRWNVELVKEHLRLREFLVRASYDEQLNLDRSTLTRVMAIDSVYLLSQFDQECNSSVAAEEDIDQDTKKKLAADMLMLENQIPGNFLLEIQGILGCGDDDVLSRSVFSFCKQESPLDLIEKQIDLLHLLRQGHLLNVMYSLILPMSETEIKSQPVRVSNARQKTRKHVKEEAEIAAALGVPGAEEIVAALDEGPQDRERDCEDSEGITALAQAMGGLPGAGGAIIQKELSIMQKVPWTMILDMLKKIDPDHKENSFVEEIRIPSVSQLTGNAGITFAPTKEGEGIRNVTFKWQEKKLYLPAITLHSNSEVVLRNLLAYEAAITKTGLPLELAEYVDLMCGIVDTPKDVQILRNKGIINGDLADAEIARIFNGIGRSTRYDDKVKKQTNTRKAIEEVKKVYGSTGWVKATRFVKKSFYKSWKFLAAVSTVLALILLALQAFCVICDCNKHWSVKTMYNPLLDF